MSHRLRRPNAWPAATLAKLQAARSLRHEVAVECTRMLRHLTWRSFWLQRFWKIANEVCTRNMQISVINHRSRLRHAGCGTYHNGQDSVNIRCCDSRGGRLSMSWSSSSWQGNCQDWQGDGGSWRSSSWQRSRDWQGDGSSSSRDWQGDWSWQGDGGKSISKKQTKQLDNRRKKALASGQQRKTDRLNLKDALLLSHASLESALQQIQQLQAGSARPVCVCVCRHFLALCRAPASISHGLRLAKTSSFII